MLTVYGNCTKCIEKYTIKILHEIISRSIFIHSSSCVWNFMLLAGRPNSVEVADVVHEVQQVSYVLSYRLDSGGTGLIAGRDKGLLSS
jgi:hypothetical protein